MYENSYALAEQILVKPIPTSFIAKFLYFPKHDHQLLVDSKAH